MNQQLSLALAVARHFGFFELYVLTHDRVVLLEDQFVWCRFFILCRVIAVASTGSRKQSGFFSHGITLRSLLDAFTACSDVLKHTVDTAFVNDFNAFGTNRQLNPTLLSFHPKATLLNIWKLTHTGLDI